MIEFFNNLENSCDLASSYLIEKHPFLIYLDWQFFIRKKMIECFNFVDSSVSPSLGRAPWRAAEPSGWDAQTNTDG